MNLQSILTSLFAASLIAGCNASPATPGAASASHADEAALAGTFVDNAAQSKLPFYSLTLNTDGTYNATGGCRPNPGGIRCFAITKLSGTWSTSTDDSGQALLVLNDSSGQVRSYPYSFDGGSLTLHSADASVDVLALTSQPPQTPAPVPSGNYQTQQPPAQLPFVDLTLNLDASFAATGDSTFTGSWALDLVFSDGSQRLTLIDDTGSESSYPYQIDPATLTIVVGSVDASFTLN